MRVHANGDVHINPSQARQLLTGTNSDAQRLLRTTTRQVVAAAKVEIERMRAVDTGQLRNSHLTGPTVVQGGKVSAEIEARKNYATAVHEGSGPRIIRPKNKQFLKFPGRDGKPVFVKEVNMPARPARPWLRNALKATASPRGFTVTGG